MTYRVAWLLTDGNTRVREHGHDLVAAKAFARRGSTGGPDHHIIKTFEGFDIGRWIYMHGRDSGWDRIDPEDRETWPYNVGRAEYEEAKRVVLAEVQEELRRDDLTPEERREMELHAAGLSGYLLRPWFPVWWGRRAIMAFIVLLGLQQAFVGNYQTLLWWLLLPFFSPRLVGGTAHMMGGLSGLVQRLCGRATDTEGTGCQRLVVPTDADGEQARRVSGAAPRRLYEQERKMASDAAPLEMRTSRTNYSPYP